MSATALGLLSVHFLYQFYLRNKRIMEREFRRMAREGPEGKYYRLTTIHGRRPERREQARRRKVPRGFIGYVKLPKGGKIITPLFNIDVETVPETSDNVILLAEYPVRSYTSVIEASTPLFRRQLSEAFRRIGAVKRAIEGR